jgi:multisubunit Na+/H+ antiporter MnhB subunit
VYNKWIKTSGHQLWIWRKPGWRVYLWVGVLVLCLVAAAIEGHAITAFKYAYFYHTGNPAILFVTSFVRDFLIALCSVAIAAKTLGFSSSRQPQPRSQTPQ